MIPVSALLREHAVDGARAVDVEAPEDAADGVPARSASRERPLVVWTATTRCPLEGDRCGPADTAPGPAELTTAEATRLLSELSAAGVATVRLAGGDPLLRGDLADLLAHADGEGLRTELSTTGTGLPEARARELAASGLATVEVTLHGRSEHHDDVTGVDGAFGAALDGIQAGLAAGLETGIRYALDGENVADLPRVLDMVRQMGVDRVRVSHPPHGAVGHGRGSVDLRDADRRAAVKTVCDRTITTLRAGDRVETVLVGNYADAGYLVEYAHERYGTAAARRVYDRLRRHGGDPAGERVACVDAVGTVHPDPAWRSYSVGNVRDRPFDAIWRDDANPLMSWVRDRETRMNGRCADCRYLPVCRGGSRARAVSAGHGLADPDPDCYLREWERQGSPPSTTAD